MCCLKVVLECEKQALPMIYNGGTKMKLVMISDKLIGQILANSIYIENGTMFLGKGNKLTESALKRLKRMGFNTIYIKDDNDEVQLQEVIETPVKLHILKLIKSLFEDIKKTKYVNAEQVFNIVQEVITNINLSENAALISNTTPSDDIAKISMHSLDVLILSMMVGCQQKYDDRKLKSMGAAALLHDIGKLFTNENNHTNIAYGLVKANTAFGATTYMSIYQLNERIDGTGPLGLPEDKIYEFAKILSICNEYIETLNHEEAVLPHEAIEKISAQTINRFDIELFKNFSKSVYCYPNGLQVKLNNGQVGVVIAQNKEMTTRPVLQIKKDGQNNYCNLMHDLTLFVQEVII